MNSIKSWKDTENTSIHIHPSGDSERNYFITGLESAYYISKILDYPYNKKVLEYGCGNGRIMKHLQALDIHGCDINPKYISKAKEQNLKCDLLENFNENDFDICYSLTVFIHLNLEDSKTALKYIHKKLKKGGLAYLQIPIYDTNRRGNSYIDINTMSYDTFKTTVEEIGFKIIEYHTSPGSFSFNNIGINHNKYQILVSD